MPSLLEHSAAWNVIFLCIPTAWISDRRGDQQSGWMNETAPLILNTTMVSTGATNPGRDRGGEERSDPPGGNQTRYARNGNASRARPFAWDRLRGSVRTGPLKL